MRKNILVLVALIAMPLLGEAQIIRTVAGNGVIGYSGDGGPATAAELWSPGEIVFDATGSYYFTDEENNVIRKVTTSGIITTYAGNHSSGYSGDGGQATAAEFSWPSGIAMSPNGTIFITDRSNQVVRMINTSGVISTFAGINYPGYSGDGGQATAAEIYNPNGLAVDAAGNNLYIADTYNSRIRVVDIATGVISTIVGNGTAGFSGDGGQATAAELNYPYGVTIDNLGNLYIADQSNNRARMVNTSGVISTIAGNGSASYSGDGGQATAAAINGPTEVVVGPAGDYMISDTYNQRVRKIFKASGIIQTIAGSGTPGYSGDGGPATAAELHFPNSITSDVYGNLFFPDWGNNVIREITNADVQGVNQIDASNTINIYPNPANDLLNVNFSSVKNTVVISLFNLLGQEVYSSTNKDISTVSIPTKSLNTGTYILKVQTEDGQVITKKVEIGR